MGLVFDPLSARFPSTRRVIYGKKGMVCSTQPLAAPGGVGHIEARRQRH